MEMEMESIEGRILRGRDALPRDYLIKIKHSSLLSRSTDKYCSNIFVVGGFKWKILLYPKGYGAAKGSYISLFISQDESNIHSSKKFGKIVLRVQDQITGKHIEVTDEVHFDFSKANKWGFGKFMSLL
ncbi:hypothetical protein Q3G72_024132 [Acer saccharum]|nr:hypothetical protein Q3G72_024132 [Acer saccharum]